MLICHSMLAILAFGHQAYLLYSISSRYRYLAPTSCLTRGAPPPPLLVRNGQTIEIASQHRDLNVLEAPPSLILSRRAYLVVMGLLGEGD